MQLDKEMILTEQLLLIHRKNLDYGEERTEYYKAIGEYRAEIEKEFTERNKRTIYIDQDHPIKRLDKIQGKADGETPDRPTILGTGELDSNYQHFIKEEGVEE